MYLYFVHILESSPKIEFLLDEVEFSLTVLKDFTLKSLIFSILKYQKFDFW